MQNSPCSTMSDQVDLDYSIAGIPDELIYFDGNLPQIISDRIESPVMTQE